MMRLPPQLLQQLLARQQGQGIGAPPMGGGPMPGALPGQIPGQPPAPPPTFNPMPFEGAGLGGLPKTGPRKGLGMGFGIGHFGTQPFVPGKGAIRGQQY